MNCSLNQDSRNKLVKLVARQLMDLAEANQKIDVKTYMKNLYEKLAPKLGDVQAAVYASYVPTIIAEVRPFDEGIKTLLRDSKVSLVLLDELEVKFTNAETKVEEVIKFVKPESESKKILNALTGAKQALKKKKGKAGEQTKLDLSDVPNFYKVGSQVEITKGANKGEIWTVVEDNGKGKLLIQKDGVTKKISNKSLKPANNESVPEKTFLQLSLEQFQTDLEYELNSEFGSPELIEVLKQNIAIIKKIIAEQNREEDPTPTVIPYREERNALNFQEVQERLARGEEIRGTILDPVTVRGYEANDHSSGTVYFHDASTGIVMKAYFKNMQGAVPEKGTPASLELVLPVAGEKNVVEVNGQLFFQYKEGGKLYPAVINVKSFDGRHNGNLAYTNSSDFAKERGEEVEPKDEKETVDEETAKYKVYRVDPLYGETDWVYSNDLAEVQKYIGDSEYRVYEDGKVLKAEPKDEGVTYTQQDVEAMVDELMQVENKIEDIKRRMSDETDTDPYMFVIRNFKPVDPQSAMDETGGSVGVGRDIHPTMTKKGGLSVEGLAEELMQHAVKEGGTVNVELDELRNIIIEILTAGSLKQARDFYTGESELKDLRLKKRDLTELLNALQEKDPALFEVNSDPVGDPVPSSSTGKKQDVVKPTVIPLNKIEPLKRINALNEADFFTAAAPTLLATTGREAPYTRPGEAKATNERVPYEETKVMYTIQRSILSKIGKNGNNTGEDVRIGDYKGVFLTPMSTTNPLLEGKVSSEIDPDKQGIVLVVTDRNGNPIPFHGTTGNPTTLNDGNRIYAAYGMQSVKDPLNNPQSEKLYKAAEALARMNNDLENIEKYKQHILNEARTVDTIKNLVAADPSSNNIRLNILGGSLGYIQMSNNSRTKLDLINTEGMKVSVKKGVGFITYAEGAVDELHGAELSLERPTVKESGHADTIKSLLFDDIRDEYNQPLSFEERNKLIQLFIPTLSGKATSFVELFRTVDPKTNEYTDKGSYGEYNVILSPLKEGDKHLVVDFNDPKSIAAAKERFDGLVNEIRFGDPAGYNQFKIHINTPGVKSGTVQVPVVENGKVTFKTKQYVDFVKEAGFQVNTKDVAADGKLRRTNSYFQFGYDSAFLNEEAVKEAETIDQTPATEVQVTEDKTVADIEQDMINDELEIDDADDFNFEDAVKANRKQDPLFTGLDVKQKSIAATVKQIEEAKAWWESPSNPLNKHISFNAMFNTVNSQAVATWAIDGITLFKGSDYSDLYHEAFHGFSQTFMTKKQREDLYKEVRRKTGMFKDYQGQYVTFKTASNKQIEEYLAESFREYMLKGQKPLKNSPKQNNLFRRIWNVLKALFEGTTAKSIAVNSQVDKNIKELYEKLRVGNLHEYSYDVRNAEFGSLNSGIISSKTDLKESELGALNYQNSKTVVDLVDYYLTDYVDVLNSNLSPDEWKRRNQLQLEIQDPNLSVTERSAKQAEYDSLKSKATYQYTGKITKNKDIQRSAYSYAKSRLNTLKNEMAKKYNAETNATLKVRYRNDYFMLKFAVENFGDVVNLELNKVENGANIDNVIAYHNYKSKVFEKSFKLEYENQSEDDGYLAAQQGWERAGNENSLKELAKAEIIYLLKTLPKYKKVNDTWEPVLNRFGVPELNDFQATWNRLARGLENSQNFDDMYRRLSNIAKKYPAVAELLNRMGNPYQNMTAAEEHGLWTNFWQTFNKARVKLVQLTVKDTQTENVSTIEARVGEAFNADSSIARRWQNALSETLPDDSNFVLKDREGNYLNTGKILQKYPDLEAVINDPMGFYKAIGFDFTDTEEIYEALSKPDLQERYKPDYFYQQIQLADKKGDLIRNINDFVNKANQRTRFKALLALEASYSDHASNFMVTNAEGNTQFEHTLNNSMTMMVSSINNARDYDDLMSMEHMQHLNVDTNPFAAASIWLKSIFDLDPQSPTYKQKKTKDGQPVSLKLTNLSGVLYQQVVEKDGISSSDNGRGVASASADEFSKLILDLHLNYAGMPELMRHADKGTSYSITVDGLLYGNDKANQNYIPIEDFNLSTYKRKAVEKIMPHIIAEIRRSNILISYDQNNIKNYDHNYIKKITGENGMFFYQFDLMLKDTTKAKLKKLSEGKTGLTEVTEIVESMKADIFNDINDYFTEQIEENMVKFNEAEFIGGNIIKDMADKGVAKSDAKDVFVRSYIYNSFIHNLESLAVIYGDLAQFNHLKEEFHKRNAGAGSTGTILRTDAIMQNHINNSLWESSYAKSLGYTQHMFDGTANTAVIEDMSIDSVYTEEYRKHIKDAADGYNGQTEGDAQGLITIDAYRQFKVAEGTWSDEQDALYHAIIENRPVDDAKVAKFFPVIKGQYWGPLRVAEGLLPVTAMHKYSLFPLIPSAIKGKKAEAVHKKMLQEGISYVTFISGSKVGTITRDKNSGYDKFYSDQQNRVLSEGIADAQGEVTAYDPSNPYFTPNVINLQFFKNQLEIHDERKGKVIFSTQLRKLIEDGLFINGAPRDFGEGLSKEERIEAWEKLSEKEKLENNNYALARVYEKNLNALTEFAKKQLLDSIGWSQKTAADGSIELNGEMSDLLEMVKQELTRQDLGDHAIDFIQIDSNGQIKYDFSAAFNVEKIEKLLNALLVKRLVKQKVNGEGLIQVANTLFEDMIAATDSNFTNPTEEHLEKYGSDDLPFYRPGKGENGKTSAMKVKVSLQGDFLKLLELKHTDEKKIGTRERLNEMIKSKAWLNTGENRKMITMVGVRIPVQGMNSMEFMEVYEFLPASAGSVIIPPTEIVTKAGADFDVDKMTVMMPNLVSVNGSTELAKQMNVIETKEELQDKLQSLRDQRKAATEKWDAIFNEKDKAKRKEFFPFTDEQNKKLDEFADQLTPLWDAVKEQLSKKAEIKEQFKGVKGKKGKLFMTLDNLNNVLNDIYEKIGVVNEERNNYIKEFAKEAFDKVVAEQQTEMKNINNNIASTQRKIYALTSKGIENDLISNIADILSLPENFGSLITPNSTELLDQHAKDMAPYATDYNQFAVSHKGKQRTAKVKGKDKTVMSPAKALEIGYNLNKHTVNSIGKDVLGIGAVDNTYNTLFNRIGAYMNPTYKNYTRAEYEKALNTKFENRTEEMQDILANYAEYKILMPYNSRKVTLKNGEVRKAIDLSDVKAIDKNKIADIINQMMNGWVDIAKDAWIFNIQGNKEVGPTLMFLVQAGVPLEQAIHFVSNPLIREYVKQQKKHKSTFAKALGLGSGNPSFAANDAKRAVLSNPRFGFEVTPKDIEKSALKGYIKARALELNKNFDSAVLKAKAEQSLKDAVIDQTDRDIFIHFLQLEEMTGATRDIKMRTNVDTTRDASLFAAQDRLGMIAELKQNGFFPEDLVDRIEGKHKHYDTPISSFFIQNFQIKLLGDAFPLRNHKLINTWARTLSKKEIDETFGNREKAVASYKSDLISFIFQNELRYFNLDKLDKYLGYEIKESKSAATEYGAIVKDGILYIDKRNLKRQWLEKSFANSSKLKTAKVDINAFSNEEEYNHFVVMREILRSQNPVQDLLKSAKFKSKVDYTKQYLSQKEGESKTDFVKRIVASAYEVYLRDEALHRTFNHYGLFESGFSFADDFIRIRETYKQLADEFPGLFNRLTLSDSKGMKNIALTTSSLEGDEINVMTENLLRLQDRSEVGRLLPEATTKELDEITQFFKDFEVYAFLQGGLNMNSLYALNQFVPQVNSEGKPGKVLQVLEKPIKDVVKELDQNTDAITKYMSIYTDMWKMANSSSKRTIRNRGKNYSLNVSLEDLSSLTQAEQKTVQKALWAADYAELYDVEGISEVLSYKDWAHTVKRDFFVSKEVISEDEVEMFDEYLNEILNKPDTDFVARFDLENMNKKPFSNFVKKLKEAGYAQVIGEEHLMTKFGLPTKFMYQEYSKRQIEEGNSYNPTNLFDSAETLANNDQNTLFIYNLATEDATNAKGGDRHLHGKGPMVFGLPTVKAYNQPAGGERLDLYRDVDGNIDPELKLAIDEAIAELVEKQEKGMQLKFNAQGYGQEMLAKDKNGNIFAPQTFVYLSQQLLNNFGYINPNFLRTGTGKNMMQAKWYEQGYQSFTDQMIQKEREAEIQELDDAYVKELMKSCIID